MLLPVHTELLHSAENHSQLKQIISVFQNWTENCTESAKYEILINPSLPELIDM